MARSIKRRRFVTYPRQLRAAIQKQLPAKGLELIPADHRVRWSDRLLVTAALLLTWLPARKMQEAFAHARENVIAMYPTRKRPGRALSGFLKAWRRRSDELLKHITPTLRQRTIARAGHAWRWGGWVVLGVDGSRINCPRTAVNEQAFGCAGRSKTAPQQLLLTIFHVASGLPWTWRRGRGDASERHLLRDALPELPKNTLLLADAGFTGYDLLQQLQRAGHAFIMRAGANVTLLRALGYRVRERGDLVYLWPRRVQPDERPLMLRLVQFGKDQQRVALLTNVLSPTELSKREVMRLYRRRWTVEVLFRSLKQTLGKRVLRGATPELAAVELDWALLSYWLLGLMTLLAIGQVKGWSPGLALDVLRRALRGRTCVGCCRLQRELKMATPDRYARHGPKQARNWPHKKNETPPGTPKIRMAKREEIKAAKALREQNHAA